MQLILSLIVGVLIAFVSYTLGKHSAKHSASVFFVELVYRMPRDLQIKVFEFMNEELRQAVNRLLARETK
jgi:hypothetical protein